MSTKTISRSFAPQRSGIKSFFQLVLRLDRSYRQRQKLARLDDAALRDMGLTREQALREATRKPWDVPNHWRA